MGELCQEFLRQTISNLLLLQRESENKPDFSEDFLRFAFRQLHTVKGTSQIFDLEDLARFTHQTENLLQALQTGQVEQNAETTRIFRAALAHLTKLAENYLAGTKTSISTELFEMIRRLVPDRQRVDDLFSRQIPARFLAQLSRPERAHLQTALRQRGYFYLLEVFFAAPRFDVGFKHFREILTRHGDVAAIAPAATEDPHELGFQVYFAGNLSRSEVENLLSDFNARIVFKTSPVKKNIAKTLSGLLTNLATDGERTARYLGKQVTFEASDSFSGDAQSRLILLNEIASHLLHNAIDHGIEPAEERVAGGKDPTAKIELKVAEAGNNLLLEIRDDGRGIDLEKITAQARASGLAPADRSLTRSEALEIIFTQGFTTTSTISEISGRGVGLDAVKDLVEKAGGTIEVETAAGHGTSFRIYLP
jgi:chemotaxis protein histidine kinase CheA